MIKPTIASLALALVMGLAVPAPAEGVRYLEPVFEAVDVTADVPYGEAINAHDELQTLELDLYAPVGDTETDRPALVLAHGGGFTGGSRTDAGIVGLAEAFARRGYIVASISYRLDPDLGYEELIVGSLAGQLPEAMHNAQHDMQAAVRWMRANADTLGVEPSLIAAGGVSAGASMALETAYNPEDPGTSNDLDVPSDIAAAVALSGATDPRRIEMNRPPVAMFNGTNDTTAPYPTALLACGMARAMLNECSLHTYVGTGHDLGEHTSEIITISAAFLCEHLLGGCGA